MHRERNDQSIKLRSDSGRHRNSSRNASLEDRAFQLRLSSLDLIKKATRHDLTEALTQLQESARLYRNGRFNTEAATDYITIGEIYLTWGQNKKALAMYRHALLLGNRTDTRLRCSIFSHMALAYGPFGEVKQSHRYAMQAVEMADKSAAEDARAEASVAMGVALLVHKDSEKALGLFRRASEIFKSAGNTDKQASATRWAGIALSSVGLIDDARNEHLQALRLWTENGNVYGIARENAALGMLQVILGETDKALEAYQQADPTFRSIGDRESEGIVLNGLGFVSQEMGDFEQSFRYFTQAWQIYRALGDGLGEVGSIDGAAKAQWALHRYKQAKTLYIVKWQKARQVRNYRFQASALSNLGDIYEHENNYRRAQEFYRRALALCRSLQHVFGETDVLIHLGRLYVEMGKHSIAIEAFRQALALGEKTRRIASQAAAHYEFGNVYRVRHQMERAKAEVESAIQIIESQRVKVSDFGSRATYFASVHQYYQLYIEILMQLHEQHPEQDYVAQALGASEKSKVRSLLDMLATSGNKAECNPGVAVSGAPDQPPRAADCIVAPAALAASQVQRLIEADDTILLEYALGDHASYLWAVQQGSISSYSLPDSARIMKLATRFRSAVLARQAVPGESADRFTERVRRADTVINSAAQELSQALLGSVAGLLSTKKRILFVPDGPLQYIPFAALPLPSPEQDDLTLADRYEVTSLPSASTLEALRLAAGSRPPPSKAAAVFADPVFSADDIRFSQPLVAKNTSSPVQLPVALGAAMRDVQFGSGKIPRLPASLKEAEEIVNVFPADSVFLATAFDASRPTVLSADLQRYHYIHFATHGILDSVHPEFSGLILSLVDRNGSPEDGYLRLRDIYNLKLSADLVVLSSCNSALGKDLESEGIIGLTRAFLSAGSQRVISTLWKVNDEATAEFMTHFYSHLHAGDSPASALRSAQSDLKKIPRWQHPYYWAAFILQGEYR